MKTKRKKPVADHEVETLERKFGQRKNALVSFMDWVEGELKAQRAAVAITTNVTLIALRAMAARRGKAAQYDALRDRMIEAIETCEQCQGKGEYQCSVCDGKGNCTCECGHEHDCSYCDGGVKTCDACRL